MYLQKLAGWRLHDKVIILFLTGLTILAKFLNFDLIGLNFKWGIFVVCSGKPVDVIWKFSNLPNGWMWLFSSAVFLKNTSKFDSFILFFLRGTRNFFAFAFLPYFFRFFLFPFLDVSTWILYMTDMFSVLASWWICSAYLSNSLPGFVRGRSRSSNCFGILSRIEGRGTCQWSEK